MSKETGSPISSFSERQVDQLTQFRAVVREANAYQKDLNNGDQPSLLFLGVQNKYLSGIPFEPVTPISVHALNETAFAMFEDFEDNDIMRESATDIVQEEKEIFRKEG